ncbi:tyrosine-type recombinase/integrase [Planomonospora sp. ID67723]|nr:tyrosine-type recombinase/integrase [Planomonospora sp. ID67723]
MRHRPQAPHEGRVRPGADLRRPEGGHPALQRLVPDLVEGHRAGQAAKHQEVADPARLRHAHATELLASDVSLDTVSKRLGHESIIVTANIYSRLSPEADQRAVDVVDQVMGGRPKTTSAAG